jgi:hypothetical protein
MPFAGFTTCIMAPRFWRELQISKKQRSTGGPQFHVPRQLYLNNTRRSSALSGELQGPRGEPPFWRYTKCFSAAQYPFPRVPYWWCELNELYPGTPYPPCDSQPLSQLGAALAAAIITASSSRLILILATMRLPLCSACSYAPAPLSPARGLAQLSQPDRLRNGTRLMRDGHTIERRAFRGA